MENKYFNRKIELKVISDRYKRIALEIMAALFILVIILAIFYFDSNYRYISYITSDIVALAFVIILTAFILFGYPLDNFQIRIFLYTTVLVFCAIYCECMNYIITNTVNWYLHYLMEFTSHVVSAISFISMWFFIRTCINDVDRDRRTKIYVGFVYFYIFIFLIYYFVVAVFRYDIGTFNFAIILGICYYSIFIFMLICICRSELELISKIKLSIYVILPMIGILISAIAFFTETDFPFESINAIWCPVGLFLIFFNILQRNQEEMIKQKHEIVESRLNTMILQANPHFVYNTLGSIEYLCKKDPDMAAAMLHDFARYLQSNAANMTSDSMIPFSQELEHLKAYLRIEQVRFPNIEVVFNIKSHNFKIPCLTLQPIVENAVRHGIGRKPGKYGTITISSYECDDRYRLTVIDNGIGFAENTEDDGRVHIGITNVRERLVLFCNGTLDIKSKPGQGTTVEITIPKINKKKDY